MNDCFFFQIAMMTTTTVMFLLIAITTSSVAAFGPVAHTTTSARIFSSSLLKPSQQLHRLHHQREVCSSRRSMSVGGGEEEEEEETVATIADDEAKYYPPLTEDEIRTILDAIPVYAVTDSNKDNGIVLLKESNNENEIANFFFSPDMANSVYAPLKSKRKGDDVIWDVTRYSLGLIWYDLLKNPASTSNGGSSSASSSMAVDGIEYRLVPNSQDLAEARNMLEQSIQQSQGENAKIPNDFQAPYNEIPVFIDQFLRVVQNDEERVPMYFGMQELIATCQQAIDATSGEYQASINIASLHSLVQQMQSKSTVDFRQAIMIPPTTPPAATTQASTAEAKEAESKIDKILNKKPTEQQPPKAELELPMATDDLWSD